MKLRRRVALYFALGSSAFLLLSRVVTLGSFRQIQEYELDRGLRMRALQEGSAVAVMGRKALEADLDSPNPGGGTDPEGDPLEQLVTYGALYKSDGSLAADTRSFAHAPSLQEIGVPLSKALSGSCFDFRYRGSILRGVLVEVKGAEPSIASPQYLLLAASRRDMDADARELLTIGWWVLAASIPLSLAMGFWFGRRTTRGIEDLAMSARSVASGRLDVTFEPTGPHDEEVVSLAAAMREMVGRLKKLVETERRFASHAAHELRSPLAVLRGELELALRRPRKPAEYEAFLRDALDDTKRLTELAENLLVVARAGAQEPGATTSASPMRPPPFEPLALRELVDLAIKESLARIGDRDGAGTGTKALDPIVRGEDVTIRGVRGDLVRMARNLVDNAIEHGSNETPIAIRLGVEKEKDRVVLTIENDGPGIAEEDRERIFEHFHRGADARAISGAGLGLGIAREVAVRHGGDLRLDSPRDPTRFVVELPLATSEVL